MQRPNRREKQVFPGRLGIGARFLTVDVILTRRDNYA